MRSFFIILPLLLSGVAMAGELPTRAPLPEGARPLEEAGRYKVGMSYDTAVKYYKRRFRSTGGVRWFSIVSQPGIKAKHIKSRDRRTDWEGINIYEYKGEVKIYVIPRTPSDKKSRSSVRKKPRR